MRLQLTDRHLLEYDGMGYILRVRPKKPYMNKGKLVEWDTEGYYGNLEQVSTGLYRHEVHASGIETVKQLISLQKEFVASITACIKAGKAPSGHSADEDE
jgi:hypothetical protein